MTSASFGAFNFAFALVVALALAFAFARGDPIVLAVLVWSQFASRFISCKGAANFNEFILELAPVPLAVVRKPVADLLVGHPRRILQQDLLILSWKRELNMV